MAVQNSCQCDFPPGGGGSCDPSQLSLCRTRGSVCHHECRNPPRGNMPQVELESWAYAQVTRTPVTGPLTTSQQDVIQARRYVDPFTGETVTFQLPGRGMEGGAAGQAMEM